MKSRAKIRPAFFVYLKPHYLSEKDTILSMDSLLSLFSDNLSVVFPLAQN